MKKKSNTGIYIFAAAVILFIAASFLADYISNMTKKSANGLIGNSACNLYNMGMFCESDGQIFFSNHLDQGMLYVMDSDLGNIRFVNEDNARYINADENYVFYSRNNNLKDQGAQSIFIFFSNGIFRVNKDGKNLKMLWNKPIGTMLCANNKIFYQHYEEGKDVSIHAIGIDGKDDYKLSDNGARMVSLEGNSLYYVGMQKDHYLHSIDIDTGRERIENRTNMYLPVVADDGVYYIDTHNGYKVCYSKLDGTESRVVVNDRCATYNISADGRYIYYQADAGDHNGVYLIDTSDESVTRVAEGDYKWINLAGDYCFFYTLDESTVYAYGNGRLSIFNPPILKKK